MVFVRKVLAPGPGMGPKATFRWRPFQAALSGSLFFIPPPLVEVMISEMVAGKGRPPPVRGSKKILSDHAREGATSFPKFMVNPLFY